MLGEGPFYPRDPNLASTWPEILPVVQKYDHVEVIDEYITINKAIAAKFEIPYVDIKVGRLTHRKSNSQIIQIPQTI